MSYPRQGASSLDNKQDTSLNGIDITSAAEKLEISVEAVRKRVQRGSLQGYKVDGRWYIILNKQDTPSETGRDTLDRTIKDSVQDNVQDSPDTGHQSVRTYKEMVKSLQDEISFLRQELSARTEENRRKDHIIAGLAQRIPELPIPTNESLDSNEQLKQELVGIIQAEVAATKQQISEQERKAEERDRQLMETLRTLQQRTEQEKEKKSWWPWKK